MKATELRERGNVELETLVRDLENELFRTRFKKATQTLDNTARMRTIRREMARIKTVLQERKLGMVEAKES